VRSHRAQKGPDSIPPWSARPQLAKGILKVGKMLGLETGTVQRIKEEMGAA
jgi:hypothetical protein